MVDNLYNLLIKRLKYMQTRTQRPIAPCPNSFANDLGGDAAGSVPELPRTAGRSPSRGDDREPATSARGRAWPAASRIPLAHRLRPRTNENFPIDLPEPTLDQLIERRPSMFKRIFRNRLAMIALAAATMGIILAASTPPKPEAPRSTAPPLVRGLV